VPALVYISSEFDVLFTVVKTTVLLADINDFGAVNEVYKQCKLHMM
jgi:enamine deaminase RidA (YjgF/YER057c/UK114 family)